MTNRPLTEEEFAVAGVSMTTCGKCGAEKRNDNGWVYFRKHGAPQVLCWSCFDKAGGRGSLADKADLLGIDDATYIPIRAASVPGLTQKTPEAVEQVFRDFRTLTPADIRSIAFTIARGPNPGDCLDWYGPVRWFSVLDSLKWLREIHDIQLRYLFGRWAKLSTVLDQEMPGDQYAGWKRRIADFAAAEFLFRYSVLLSDTVEAAHRKAAGKKDNDAKVLVFEKCKDAVLAHPPPESLADGQGELLRFVDYIDTTIRRAKKPD